MGQIWKDPRLFVGKWADRINLQPFYDLIHAAIRSVDKDSLIIFESVNTDIRHVGFTHPPGNEGNKSVLGWHYYTNAISTEKYFQMRVKEAARLHSASFATEMDITWDGAILRKDPTM